MTTLICLLTITSSGPVSRGISCTEYMRWMDRDTYPVAGALLLFIKGPTVIVLGVFRVTGRPGGGRGWSAFVGRFVCWEQLLGSLCLSFLPRPQSWLLNALWWRRASSGVSSAAGGDESHSVVLQHRRAVHSET